MRSLAALVAAAVLVVPAAGASTAHAASACSYDRQYLQRSIRASLFSIAGGRIAAGRATDPDVQSLAQRLVADHLKALSAAARAAHGLHVAVPGNPDAVEHWELNVVAGLSGNAFDRRFSWLVAARAGVDEQDAAAAAGHACTAPVRTLARTRLHVLQAELRLAALAQRSAGKV